MINISISKKSSSSARASSEIDAIRKCIIIETMKGCSMARGRAREIILMIFRIPKVKV